MKQSEEQFLQNYYKVINKLMEHNLMFKQVKECVGLSKPKVLYYVDKDLKLTGTDISRKKHERHLFSIIDLFGLMIVDELRLLSIQTEIGHEVFQILRKYLTEKFSAAGPTLIQALSSGKPMDLWIDNKALQLGIIFIFPTRKGVLRDQIENLNRPRIIVPLTPIWDRVVCKITRLNFQIKKAIEKKTKEMKLFYIVDGEQIDIAQYSEWHDGYILYLDESKVEEKLAILLQHVKK